MGKKKGAIDLIAELRKDIENRDKVYKRMSKAEIRQRSKVLATGGSFYLDPQFYSPYMNDHSSRKVVDYDPVKDCDVETPWSWRCFILLGSRGRGKTLVTQYQLLYRYHVHNESIFYVRGSVDEVEEAERDSSGLFDSLICEIFKIETIKVVMGIIYINDAPVGKILNLSKGKSYKSKDMSIWGKGNMFYDEAIPTDGERRMFDINRAVYNLVESVMRGRKCRIFMCANLTGKDSDILTAFRFFPEKFGTYRIKKKDTIIFYLDDSEKFKAAQKRKASNIFNANYSESNNTYNDRTIYKTYDGRVDGAYHLDCCVALSVDENYKPNLVLVCNYCKRGKYVLYTKHYSDLGKEQKRKMYYSAFRTQVAVGTKFSNDTLIRLGWRWDADLLRFKDRESMLWFKRIVNSNRSKF